MEEKFFLFRIFLEHPLWSTLKSGLHHLWSPACFDVLLTFPLVYFHGGVGALSMEELGTFPSHFFLRKRPPKEMILESSD